MLLSGAKPHDLYESQIVRGDVFEMEEVVDSLGGTRKMRTGNAEKEDFMGRPKVVLYMGTVISPG